MANDKIINLTENNFDNEVLNADCPVLVDFWATWCGPCRMVLPIMDELADDFQGRAKICKVNVDEAGSLAARYGVASIPTVIVFSGGEIKDKAVGAQAKEHYEEMLENA